MSSINQKVSLSDLKVETFTTEISADELEQIQSAGGGTYGTACGATRSYNCFGICADNKD